MYKKNILLLPILHTFFLLNSACALLSQKPLFLLPRQLFASSLRSAETTTVDYGQIAKDVFSKDERPVILFDGICNLCNGGVNYALDHDEEGVFRFASLQSTVGQSLLVRSGKKPDDVSSIVLVTHDKAYFKSDAVLRIVKKLNGGTAILSKVGVLLPKLVKDFIYDYVAKNRFIFGEADQCRLYDENFDDRFVPDPVELGAKNYDI